MLDARRTCAVGTYPSFTFGPQPVRLPPVVQSFARHCGLTQFTQVVGTPSGIRLDA